MRELATEYLMNNYTPVPESGCWLWLGGWDVCGYGRINKHGRIAGQAHRLFFEVLRWPIPAGLSACHKCDTPACVNPDHLFLGTHSENMRDMHKKGRRAGRRRKP